MKKRIAALFLLVCMLLTMLPVGALADDDPVTGGDDGNSGETHTHNWGAWTDAGDQHTRKCTDTNCNATESGAHDYVYTSDGSGKHTGACKVCSKTLEPEDCSGGTATCKEKAKCAKCGGSYGELSTEHDYVYTSDGSGKHTGACKVCSKTLEPEDCSGGTATCKEKAKCAKCGGSYGELSTEHDYAYTSDGTGKHTGACKVCGKTLEPEDCSGGTATCTEPAKCDKCGGSYGSVDLKNHKQAAKPRHIGDVNDKKHEYYCELCDASIKKESCSLTKATCVEPETCTKCGQSYGDVSTKHEWVWKSNGDGTHSQFCKHCGDKKDNTVKKCAKDSKPRHLDGTDTHEYYCKDCGGSIGKAEDCTKKYTATKNGTHKVQCKVCEAVLAEDVPCSSDPSTDRCGQKAYCQYCNQDFGDKLGHDFSSGGGCARFPEGRCTCTKASHRKLWNKTNAGNPTVRCDKCHTDVEKEKIRADFTVSNYKLNGSVSSLRVSTSSAHVKVKSYTVSPDAGKFAADQEYTVTVEFTTDPGYEVTYATIGGSTATLTDSHNAAMAKLPKFGTEFTVTYDKQGHGTLKNATEKVTYPGKAHPEKLTATGYVFGGWYMDRDCTTAFNANVPVAANMTLYAKWSVARTLTFKTNSGKMSPTSKSFADGTVVKLKDYTPTRKGYWFCGWFKDKDLTGRKLETIKMDANKTVYAKWKKEDTTNPKTGDNSGWAMGILALTTVLGAAAVVTKKKRVW